MAGELRLLNPDMFHQLPNRLLPLRQKLNDADPGGVSECPKEARLTNLCFHRFSDYGTHPTSSGAGRIS